MRNETEYLLERFPVRKTEKQKAAFRDWLTDVLRTADYEPQVEEGKGIVKSHNVVVGDPDTAKVVFTAHYDTPARLPIPNILFPHNMLFSLLAQLPLFIFFFLAATAVDVAVVLLTDSFFAGLLAVYAVLLVLLVLMLAGPANPSNVNDNTSGVATLLETALSLPAGAREGTAFVFFDNEELGLLGSSAFCKKHKKAMKETLLVNFDCVSDGDHIRFYPNRKLKKRPELLELLERSFPSGEGKDVVVTRGGHYPSDQKHFPLGVGVCALYRGRFGLRSRRIHTSRDTIFQAENIELLRKGAVKLAEQAGRACANEL